MRDTLSIVIPSYNEEGNVREMYRRIKAATEPLGLTRLEILFVDDGSTDGTVAACRELQKTDSTVKIVRFFRNFGNQAAMMAGLEYATCDAVIIMDGDLQHPPEYIPQMVGLWQNGADIVLTKRTANADATRLYRLFARGFYRFINTLSETPIPRNTPDFRLLDRKYVELMKKFDERGVMVRGMLGMITPFDKFPTIEFTAPERHSGESKFTFRTSLELALDSMVHFSVKPLVWPLWCGIGVGVLAVVYALYLIGVGVTGGDVYTDSLTLLAVLVLGGGMLFFMGVFGVYLAKVHLETKKRPKFLAELITADMPPAPEPEEA